MTSGVITTLFNSSSIAFLKHIVLIGKPDTYPPKRLLKFQRLTLSLLFPLYISSPF